MGQLSGLNLDYSFNPSHSGNYNPKVRRLSDIKYIVIHYTANNGDTAAGNGLYFHRNKVGCGAHYFVDEKSCVQSVYDKYTAYHCETPNMKLKCGCRNYNSIGIEMCSDFVNNKYVIMEQTKKNTAVLVKYLMTKYRIKADKVIRHYDVCGKLCPEPWVRAITEWQSFKTMLTEEDKPIETKKFKFIEATVDGKECKFTGFTENNENWIKVSSALQAIGYSVQWNSVKKRAIAVKDGKETLLDIRTYISADNISFCPIRDLYSLLGYVVVWDSTQKKIMVY